MKQRPTQRLCQATLALMLASCSSSGTSAGNTTGGANSGGANSGGANSGGANSGGANSGGANSGGANSGGTTDAGNTNGGATSGAATSGAATSGANTAGYGASGGTRATAGTIVPLYTDPGDASWTAVVAAKSAHPAVTVVAIVNPDSGPGVRIDASYTSGITRLVAAGITPIGYVSTTYTARGEAAVKSDIDSWHSFYPNLKGIFFDEQSDKAGDDTFYRDVSSYAKALGLAFTVGNPGTNVPSSYVGALDVMLIYESKGLPALSSLAGHAAARAQYGIIPYGAAFDAAFVIAAKADVQYIYATNDDLPNPWDTLPPYFSDLLSALQP